MTADLPERGGLPLDADLHADPSPGACDSIVRQADIEAAMQDRPRT